MNAIQMTLNLDGLTFPNQDAKLSHIEKKVLNLIPKGKDNAKPCSYIAKTLHIHNRTVIKVVRQLRLKRFDIGSDTNGGYYKFKDEKEYIEFMSRYSKEELRRKQVSKSMKQTSMAKRISIDVNQKGESTNERN